jgi:hypothetical protein
MKLSKKFLEKLDSYTQWAKCRMPMSGWAAMEGGVMIVSKAVTSMSPEEAIFRWETYGENIEGSTDPNKLAFYKRGKAMRDWWFQEKGEWQRLCNGRSMFLPEEMAEFFVPDCFFELFGRYPITALVRHFYDNRYSTDDFDSDMRYRAMGLDPEQDGYRVFRESLKGTCSADSTAPTIV